MKPNLQEHLTESETIPFDNDSDICHQLLSRYSTSKAPHHHHLLATAAAIRSILSSESLLHTPPAYFVAAIDNLSHSGTLDSTAVAALLSFVSIVVPLIPEKGIKSDKASEAAGVLVAVVRREELGAASVGGLIKCLGILITRFCDLEHWGSVKEGFETVLKFSIDKRPKVRRSAQDCLEKVFMSLNSFTVIKESSKLVLSLLKNYMPVALTLSKLKVVDGSKHETLSKSGHLEVLHVLNLMKSTVPYLSVKIRLKVLSEILQLMYSQFTALTRHTLQSIEVFFETSREEDIGPYIENIVDSLSLYVSFGEKNPMDTLIYAANLLKIALDKLSAGGSRSWIRNVPKVCGAIAVLLTYETPTTSQASDIIKEIINNFMDNKKLVTDRSRSFEDISQESEEANMIKATCDIFETTLSSCNGNPNEHLLEVLSALFLKLGELSFIFMKTIVLKLADVRNHFCQDKSDTNHLQNCIGSAVIAMGPEKMLTLIPISVCANNFTCSNIWLVPILKKHVVGASLAYYMEHIVPLAKSFVQASQKVEKSVTGQDLHATAYGLFGLLPSFCHHPVDTHRKFGPLAELLITFLKEDAFMHQNVAVALQILVSQNKSAINSKNDAGESQSSAVEDNLLDFRNVSSHSKKMATRNINALASFSPELLQALVDLFVASPPEKRLYIKDAVGSLASITDSSITKKILMSLLERFQLVNGKGEFEQLISHGDESIDTEQGSISVKERNAKRFLIMELASSLIEGAKEDLVNLIYDYVVHIVKETDVTAHGEAYYTLSRILQEHAWFCSSQFVEPIDLLLGLKPPTDVAVLRNRFACFRNLVVHILEISLEEENMKAFLIFNEIILTLKDAKDEVRKVAYDTLLMISSTFRISCTGSFESYHKMISMIMGYLSSSSPQIKSGAVSALSVLVYNDADICVKMPDLVPSLLSLLQSKAVEVIKAVLGFVKVLVSSLQAKELQNLLSDITNGVLLWSTVSRFHFRSKVTVILEIMIRKCGSAAVELVTPERHKNFVRTVLENRQHKSSSKEAGPTDRETMLVDSKSQRMDKQEHKGNGSISKENGSMHHGKRKRTTSKENGSMHHGKRKRTTKENESPSTLREPGISSGDDGGTEGTKRARHSKHEKSITGQSADGGKKRMEQRNMNKKNLIQVPASGGKKRMEERNMNKKGGRVFHRPAFTSKLHKPNKIGRNQKRSTSQT